MTQLRSPQAHSASIDGLRSVAVLPVLIGHAFPNLLPGGFIGVDIFFVISGFLIASMITDKSLKGEFSLADFYKRRILRIFPALFVMLLVTTIACLLLLPPFPFREFGQALVASSVFASNILFWMKSGYFDAASEANPLVHTWSLAVEEQFYIVAPLMALLVVRSRVLFYLLLACVGLASLAFAEATNSLVPSTYFFFTANRIFELIVGCMVGCAFHAGQMGELKGAVSRLSPLAVNILAGSALAALAWSFVGFGPQSAHPGLITLIPVLATGTLLALHQSGSLAHRLLALKPLVMIGLISYSLYLIHQPLLAIGRVMTLGEPSKALLVGLLVASLPLAYLMWRFVELPFREYRRFSLRQTFVGAGVLIAAGVAVGFFVYKADGLPGRFSAETIAITRPMPIAGEALDTTGIARGQNIVLWGDSHAGMLYPAMQEWAKQTGGQVDLLTNGGCPPIPGFDNDWRNLQGPRCSQFNAGQLDKLLEIPAGATVVLAARWPNYLRAPDALNEFGHPWTLASRSIFPEDLSSWQEPVIAQASDSLHRTISVLTAHGHKVVVIGSVPHQRAHADDVGFLSHGNAKDIRALSISLAFHRQANADAKLMLDAAFEGVPDALLVDPADLLCGEGKCPYLLNGKMAYEDDNHLNDWGAALIAKAIMRASEKQGPAGLAGE